MRVNHEWTSANWCDSRELEFDTSLRGERVPTLTEDANDEPGIENILNDTLTLPRKIKAGTQSGQFESRF